VINVLAVLVVWGALISIWRPSRVSALAALAVLVSQQSLVYLSSMSRPASFCLFYWALALGTIAVARRVRVPVWRVVIFAVSAVLAGLCFLTKIQSLLYVLVLPLFMTVRSPVDTESKRSALDSPDRRHALAASIVGAVLFFGLLAVVRSVDMPDFHGFYATGYGCTTRLKVLCAAVVALLAVNCWHALGASRRRAYPAVFYWYSIALPGLMLAFPVCILLGDDLSEGCRYMLWAAKVSLMRQDYSGYTGLSGIVRKLIAEGVFLWPLLAGHVVVVGAAVWLWLRRRERRWAELFPIVALSGAAFLNLGMATRCTLRDVGWMEFLLNVTTVAGVFYCGRALRNRPALRRLPVGIVLTVVFLFNIGASCRMFRRIDANYNVYGWDPLYWCRGYYVGRSHEEFDSIMRARYGVDTGTILEEIPVHAGRALRQALRYARDERWAGFVFPTVTPSVRTIGPLAADLPVWCSRTEWVVESVDGPVLNGPVVVDPLACRRRSSGLLHREFVVKPSEWFRKLKQGDPANVCAVLPRRDTRVYVLVEKTRVRPFCELAGFASGESDVRLRVTLRNGAARRILHGIEIEEYAEIPWSALGRDACFVLESCWMR